jgi:hypothetical protein
MDFTSQCGSTRLQHVGMIQSGALLYIIFKASFGMVPQRSRESAELKQMLLNHGALTEYTKQTVPKAYEILKMVAVKSEQTLYKGRGDTGDGFSGYYQNPLDEKSEYLTGDFTPLGIRM